MKTFISIIIAAVIASSFCSCGVKSEDPSTAAPISDTTAEDTETMSVIDESTENNLTEQQTQETQATETEAVTDEDLTPKTKAEIVAYFNEVINKVKPESKTIIQNYTLNTQAGELELGKAKSLQKLANDLVEANMGYNKKAANRVMNTRADKDAYFAVEGMSWSSKLTADDVKSASLSEKDGVYTITIQPKDDEPSPNTVKGYGHVGKAMSVVEISSITDNAGLAKSIIKNIKTGHRSGKIVVTVDAATGNVSHANYYFIWDLWLTADIKILDVDVTVAFGIEQDFDIKW